MTWWNDAVGYEIYIRSFADSDGDGIGDLGGIADRLDHLAWLGVDVVWITPFYPSPQADFGYDVADYVGVDRQFGDLAAFDAVVERAGELGLRVMVDLVPNHTSSAHPWFVDAQASPDGPHRDYYLFRPPAPDGGPPNNWVSNFGGPAWTFDEASGEYYCHLFLPEQPDLNWANEAVRQEFDDILGFWMERGVAGFRIDVAHALMKDPGFGDNPQIKDLGENPTPQEAFSAFEHLYDQNQESTRDIYRRWKKLEGADTTFFLGEVYVTEPAQGASYMNDGGIDLSLFFALNRRPWDPVAFVTEIREWAETSPAGFAWTIASHDENRPVTRFGGGKKGRERAVSLWTALAMLPGMPFLYQGEELGLEDGVVAVEDIQDPVGLAAPEEGRDPARTPMPWEPGPHGGFTEGEPWLRSEPRSPGETVAVQREDPASPLHTYRRFLTVRKALAERRSGPVIWLDAEPGVIAFAFEGMAVLANLTDMASTVDIAPNWEIVYDTSSSETEGGTGPTTIPPRTTLLILI